MRKYLIICPNCEKQELNLTITKNWEECEICQCGFPENAGIKEWCVSA